MTVSESVSISELVKSVVEEMGRELDYEALHHVTPESPLFGGTEGVDSLCLVSIVAELERVAGETFGKRVVLADDRAMSRRNSPYRTVGSLTELLEERLAETT